MLVQKEMLMKTGNYKLYLAVLSLTLAGMLPMAAAQTSSMGSNSSTTMGRADTGTSDLSTTDKKFIKDAADGGMAEVAFGQLAVQKASSQDVKQFGQRMVDDHSKANDQLKQIASSKGIELPQDLTLKDKATQERLSKLSGEEFDKAYMADMVKDHKADIAEFNKESRNGTDAQVKDFASTTLPTLEDHLKQAETTNQKMQNSMTGMK